MLKLKSNTLLFITTIILLVIALLKYGYIPIDYIKTSSTGWNDLLIYIGEDKVKLVIWFLPMFIISMSIVEYFKKLLNQFIPRYHNRKQYAILILKKMWKQIFVLYSISFTILLMIYFSLFNHMNSFLLMYILVHFFKDLCIMVSALYFKHITLFIVLFVNAVLYFVEIPTQSIHIIAIIIAILAVNIFLYNFIQKRDFL